MILKPSNIKIIFGFIYLIIILVILYFLFSYIDLDDLTNYEILKENKDTIFKY